MTEWRCTNGHDRCFNTTPGPDCPMCERDDTVETDEDEFDDLDYDEDDGDALASAGLGTDEDYGPPPGGDD